VQIQSNNKQTEQGARYVEEGISHNTLSSCVHKKWPMWLNWPTGNWYICMYIHRDVIKWQHKHQTASLGHHPHW